MPVTSGSPAPASRASGRRRLKTTLAVGSSLAALAALGGAGQALADTTVSGGSTPVATATAAAGAPDNIVQTGALSVGSGAAVTLNSDNSITNSGTIEMQDIDGVTGVLALGGHSGSVTNSGSITVNESAATTTTDSAGNIIGPFATGSDRFGIRVQGPGALQGDLANSGAITVQGADSAGVSVEAPLNGAIASSGSITVSGARSYGLRTTGPVSGGVTLSGGVSAQGEGAQAVAIGGDVGGGLVIESAVTATGYHSTVRSATASVLADQNLNDVAQGGPAVSVAGDLAQGLLVSAPPAVLSSSVADANGDGLADAGELAGSVTAYGSAPAIVVGTVGRDVRLGDVGTGDSAYGIVIAGAVAGAGIDDGVAATGLQLGVAGGGGVAVQDGISVTGSLTATAYGGDATALHLYSGAAAPLLYNAGQITAKMTGEGSTNAQAIVLEAGASIPTIKNAGAIQAVATGSTGDAAAILDRAGSLTRLENVGLISAVTMAATGSTATPTGSAVAIDDQANTTGLSLLNYQPAGSATTPTIAGAILLGSGDDSLDVEAGSVTGDISFGAGRNALTIDGGAAVAGDITAQGGTLALDVRKGSLQIDSPERVALTSLNLGAGSSLLVTLDPAHGAATELDVAGPATIAADAKIGVRMLSLTDAAATYTLIHADQLTASAIDASLLGATPYVYASRFALDPAAGTLAVTLSRKTAQDLGLPASMAGGYEPVIAAASATPALSQGLLAATDRKGFMSAYNSLLPEHSGGVFEMVAAGLEGFARPIDDRQGGGDGGAWVQEVNVGALASDRGDAPGYDAWGVGVIGGYELSATRAGIFGLTFGGLTGQLDPHQAANGTEAYANLLEAGGYWRASYGPFAVNARLAAEYLTASSNRAVELKSGDETLFSGTATGHWSGWGLTSRLHASYERRWDVLYVRPQLGLDYVQLSEGAYQEEGGGAIDLAVGARDTSRLSSFAGVAVGATWGDDASSWGPELLLGYRDILSASGGETTARFSSGEIFSVGPTPVGDQGFVARLALKSEDAATAFSLEGGAETREGLTVVDAKLAAHFRF